MDARISHSRPVSRRRERIDRDRWVSIRPIERADAAGLSDFYARLSPESMRRRFLSCAQRSCDDLARRFAAGDGFVAVLAERGPNDGAIVAHASLHPDEDGGAEIAFAVADELQGRGIGRALVAAVVGHARRAGIHRLTATMLAENASMRRLLRDAGCRVTADAIDAGVEEIDLEVALAA